MNALKLDSTEMKLKARILKHTKYRQWTLVRWYIDQLSEYLIKKDKKEKAHA